MTDQTPLTDNELREIVETPDPGMLDEEMTESMAAELLAARGRIAVLMLNAVRHRMLPGSHVRLQGPECVCGSDWDRWSDCCSGLRKLREARDA